VTKFIVLIAAAVLAGCATTDRDPLTANVRYCDEMRSAIFKPAPRPVDCGPYDRARAVIDGYRAADKADYRDSVKGPATQPGVFRHDPNARIEQEINTHRWFVKP
jgi:hypothetical protein